MTEPFVTPKPLTASLSRSLYVQLGTGTVLHSLYTSRQRGLEVEILWAHASRRDQAIGEVNEFGRETFIALFSDRELEEFSDLSYGDEMTLDLLDAYARDFSVIQARKTDAAPVLTEHGVLSFEPILVGGLARGDFFFVDEVNESDEMIVRRSYGTMNEGRYVVQSAIVPPSFDRDEIEKSVAPVRLTQNMIVHRLIDDGPLRKSYPLDENFA